MTPQRLRMLEAMKLGPVWRLRQPSSASANASNRTDAAHPAGSGEVMQKPDWVALEAEIAQCTACPLAATRTRTVPGVGDRSARWLFVGEGPGAEEDVRGEPFVGAAGHLLDAMLKALGLDRRQAVFIANTVKCRPPGNRTPTAGEMAACRPYLERQIAWLQPEVIVLLGKAAAQSILGREEALGKLRGSVYRYGEVPVVATYHPAYLLRTPGDKARAWADLCLARRQVAPPEA